MHLDVVVSAAGFVVGVIVGLTGMGGGALMTPILVLLFGIEPLAAVSSDLAASFVMKPVGGGVHLRRGTVNIALVRWLVVGSVPSAFLGVVLLRSLGDQAHIASQLRLLLGLTLLVASASIVGKTFLQASRPRVRQAPEPFHVRPVVTALIGALGGLVVGMTSVGSGSLIIVMLLLVYPKIRMSELVGTDLVQAIPLVGSAALGHFLFGDFHLELTFSVLLGSLPGVYLGARASARAPDRLIRSALVVVLLASALKLLNVSNIGVAIACVAAVASFPSLRALADVARQPVHRWIEANRSRRAWAALLLVTAPIGVGLAASQVYFRSVRPALRAAGETIGMADG
jgi:uncharacterized membrane protein YfcA